MVTPIITLVVDSVTATLQDNEHNRVLSWEEEETSKVAIKDIATKTTDTVETEIWSATPKVFILICRLTGAEKLNLESVESTQSTTSISALKEDGVTKYNVWIESIDFGWRGDECFDAPWFTEIRLRKKS